MVKRRREREEQEEEESNRGNTPAKAWFYPSLFWGLPPNVHTRQDGAKALQAWDVIIAVACLYQGFMVPFSLCFEKLYLTAGSDANTSEQCLFAPNVAIHPDAPFFISRYVDVVVDFLFIVDIGLNFVSARWVLEVEPMEHWQLYDNISDISKLYVTDGSFALDFLGSLPVQYLNCIPGLSAGNIKLMRLFRMIKLVRLNRLKQLLAAIQTAFPKSVYITAAAQLLTVFSLFAHISACLFFYMAYGMADPDGTEYEKWLYFNGWVYEDGILDEKGDLRPMPPVLGSRPSIGP